jgi:hypothetical protein
MAASTSGAGLQTAAALTRVAGCCAAAGFAGSCATHKEVAAHSIKRRILLRIISPSCSKNDSFGLPYAQLVQKVKNDFHSRSATKRHATLRPLPSAMRYRCRKKKWGGFAPRPM